MCHIKYNYMNVIKHLIWQNEYVLHTREKARKRGAENGRKNMRRKIIKHDYQRNNMKEYKENQTGMKKPKSRNIPK